MLLEALEWHDLGFSVIPIHTIVDKNECTCGDPDCHSPGKHPALNWTRFQKNRSTRENIIAWLEHDGKYKGYNIGLVTGAVSNNIFVVDVDVGPGKEGRETIFDLQIEHGEFPETIRVTTGSGGDHYFFKAPEGERIITDKNILGPGIDIRGEGGMVVTTPSLHHSGNLYEFHEGSARKIADSPEWLLSAVREKATEKADHVTQNMWGQLTDGREGYAYQLLCGTVYGLWTKEGIIPTADELVEEAWPVYERKVATREMDLDAEGRGEKFFRKKAEIITKKAAQGRLNILEGVEAGSKKPGLTAPPSEEKKELKLTDHFLKSYAGDPPEREWLIENKLPLGISGILAGQGGIGKSYLMLRIGLQVAGGDQGMHEEKALSQLIKTNGTVVYLTAEDGRDSIHRRLGALNQNLRALASEKLIVVALPDAGGVQSFIHQDPQGNISYTDAYLNIYRQLRELNKTHDIKLVIFDPLQPFSQADINSQPSAAQFWWSMMNALASEIKATILVTHHMRKDGMNQIEKGSQARESIRGTSALVDGARWAYALWNMPTDQENILADRLGFEPGNSQAICGAIVKANDFADQSIDYFIKDENGVPQERTNEVLELLESSSSLETQQIAQIFSEIKRRWLSPDPFAIGQNTPRSFIAFLRREYGLTTTSAKRYMNQWIDQKKIENAIKDSKSSLKGIKVNDA